MKAGFTDKGGDGHRDHDGESPAEAGQHEKVESAGSDELTSEESRGGSAGVRAVHSPKAKKQKKRGIKGRVAELEEELEEARKESAENHDRWLRARAEYDNLRKRTLREIQQVHLRAGEDLIRKLLPVIDNLEKAIEASHGSQELRSMTEGLLLIQKGLMESLSANGVDVMDPLGDKFDPSFHEAVMQMQTDEAEPGTVVQVLQRGYLMNGVTLRPAKVVVAGPGKDPKFEERGVENSKADGDAVDETVDQGEPSGGEV